MSNRKKNQGKKTNNTLPMTMTPEFQERAERHLDESQPGWREEAAARGYTPATERSKVVMLTGKNCPRSQTRGRARYLRRRGHLVVVRRHDSVPAADILYCHVQGDTLAAASLKLVGARSPRNTEAVLRYGRTWSKLTEAERAAITA